MTASNVIKFPEPPHQAAMREEFKRLTDILVANRASIKRKDFEAHFEHLASRSDPERALVDALRRMLFD